MYQVFWPLMLLWFAWSLFGTFGADPVAFWVGGLALSLQEGMLRVTVHLGVTAAVGASHFLHDSKAAESEQPGSAELPRKHPEADMQIYQYKKKNIYIYIYI